MEKTVLDLTAEIRRHRWDNPMKTEVRTGSLTNFVRAIERKVGRVHEQPKGVTECNICGITVQETDLLPPNRAVMMLNGEIVQLINLDL